MDDGEKGGSLASSAARGASVTLVGQVARLLIQLGGVVILSRLLTPADFGIVAMVIVFMGLGDLLRDFGLGSAAVQARVLTRQQRDNLFWINTGLGGAVAAILAASAPAIAAFYQEPRLVPVAHVLALTLILNGMTAQYRASLSRNLRFGQVTLTDVLPAAMALGVAAVTALFGWGYWALVSQQVAYALLALLFSIAFGRWIPCLPRKALGMGALIVFGANLLGVSVLNYLTRNVDSVVVGVRFGAANLGLYNRAYELVTHSINRINMPLTRVAVAVLARIQDDAPRHKSFLMFGQRVLLHITLPLLALGATLAYPLVTIVLGENWLGSAPILQILAVGAAADVAGYAAYWYALSKGVTGVYLRINLVVAPLRVAAILVGSYWGTVGVAAGFAAGSVLLWLVALAWLWRSAGAPSGALLIGTWRPILLNAAVSAVTTGVLSISALSEPGLQIAVGVAVFAGAWGAAVLCIPGLRREVRSVLEVRKRLRP